MVYGVSQAFAVNAKNELTTAVGLACTYDASGTGGHSTEILGYAYDTAWYSLGIWSTHNHYHADGNGNVTFLVNSGQTAEAWYRFDPYGRTMAQSATALTTENLYRFSSKEIHALSGMYYYGFRFYDPHLQRWPNRDPYGEPGAEALHQYSDKQVSQFAETLPASHNLYCFVLNNPVRYKDLWGLKVTPQDCANFQKECLADVTKLMMVGLEGGVGSGACTLGIALAVGKKINKGAGLLVGLGGSAWAYYNLNRNMSQATAMQRRCSDMYDRCMRGQGLL